MKKTGIICLALCLTALLLFGCGNQAQQGQAAEATPEGSADLEQTPEVVVYTEPVEVLRLDSIDMDLETQRLLLNITPVTYKFEDAAEGEQEVETQEGEPKQLILSEEAVIDFPLLDNLAQTVTLLPGELTQEYLAFVQEMDEKPEFIAEMEGDVVNRLTYFYLP